MPVILGPDGPSLGGFVCPVTVIEADLWQLGQLKAGDKLRFEPVDLRTARELALKWDYPGTEVMLSRASPLPHWPASPVVLDIGQDDTRLVARLAGDTHLLLEIGAPNWTWCCAFAAMR